MSNTLQAIYRVAHDGNQKLLKVYKSKNRANAMGDALEEYIKDAFSGSTPGSNKAIASKLHSECFSYIGNQNNPPDFILKDGDAIEVKKVEGFKSALALNSSYPKSKLHVDDCRISNACRGCEDWSEKDIIYVVGCVPNNELKMLYVVYGDCYAADRETYEGIRKTVRDSLTGEGIETENTNELAKVRKVDPLGITSLRVRGMWHIENPSRVFDYLYEIDRDKKFQLVCIMRKEKWDVFSSNDRKKIEEGKDFAVRDLKAKSPNNPAQFIDIKLITFSK